MQDSLTINSSAFCVALIRCLQKKKKLIQVVHITTCSLYNGRFEICMDRYMLLPSGTETLNFQTIPMNSMRSNQTRNPAMK